MTTYRNRKYRAAIVTAHAGRCWICGHFGAKQIDDVTPQTEGGNPFDPANLRPAHGAAPGTGMNPCLVCSAAAGKRIFCNGIKGGYTVERARRKIAEKITANGGTPDLPGYGRPPDQPAAWPQPPGTTKPGRAW